MIEILDAARRFFHMSPELEDLYQQVVA